MVDMDINAPYYQYLNDRDWLWQRYYVEKRSATSIARSLECSRSTVDRALVDLKIPRRRTEGRAKARSIPQLSDRKWLSKQIQTKTVREIAAELGCTPNNVYSALRRFGIAIPKRTTRRKSPTRSEAIKKTILEKYGSDGRRGNRAGNWRGGVRYVGPYVHLHRDVAEQRWPNHPRLRRKNWTYCQEHVLVVEADLGRCLRKGEVVHHKDDVKDNNERSNLEVKKNGNHIREHFSAPKVLRARITYLESLLDVHGIPYQKGNDGDVYDIAKLHANAARLQTENRRLKNFLTRKRISYREILG